MMRPPMEKRTDCALFRQGSQEGSDYLVRRVTSMIWRGWRRTEMKE